MKTNQLFKKIFFLLGLLALAGLSLAACQLQETVPVTGPVVNPTTVNRSTQSPVVNTPQAMPVASSPAPKTTSSGPEAVLNVANDPKLGKILVGNNGMTLYMYSADGPNQSNCSGGCVKAWPPLLTQGSPTLGDGIDKTLVGSATLADGSKIVTYNKMPLYYWMKDTKAGDTSGQNVGKVWFVVSPDGKPVGK